MSESYTPDKLIWTESDFEIMGWHDCHIHAIAFDELSEKFELVLDLDYIFKWIDPIAPQKNYSFWIAPCTLIFENVHSLSLDLQSVDGLEIDNVSRANVRVPRNSEFIHRDKEWDWTIECQEGTITFCSVGFKQFVRSPPVRNDAQSLSLAERGGRSFERID